MKILRWVPNILTIFRICIAIALIFFKSQETAFLILYSIGGVSDVLDGVIARAAKCSSELGSRLDSLADIMVNTVMLAKLLPIMIERLPEEILYWYAGILLVRLFTYILAAIKYKKLASLHTYMNKATGFTLFLLPYSLHTPHFKIYCIICCIVATLSCLEELIMHCTAKEYIPKKYIFERKNNIKKA